VVSQHLFREVPNLCEFITRTLRAVSFAERPQVMPDSQCRKSWTSSKVPAAVQTWLTISIHTTWRHQTRRTPKLIQWSTSTVKLLEGVIPSSRLKFGFLCRAMHSFEKRQQQRGEGKMSIASKSPTSDTVPACPQARAPMTRRQQSGTYHGSHTACVFSEDIMHRTVDNHSLLTPCACCEVVILLLVSERSLEQA
jgi:hypothetical protein